MSIADQELAPHSKSEERRLVVQLAAEIKTLRAERDRLRSASRMLLEELSFYEKDSDVMIKAREILGE